MFVSKVIEKMIAKIPAIHLDDVSENYLSLSIVSIPSNRCAGSTWNLSWLRFQL